MSRVIRHGVCYFCLDDDLDIFIFDGDEMCFECGEGQFDGVELKTTGNNYAYEAAEDWLPEHGFDDE